MRDNERQRQTDRDRYTDRPTDRPTDKDRQRQREKVKRLRDIQSFANVQVSSYTKALKTKR